MNDKIMNTPDDLLEALADLEHQQWMQWSQTVAPEVTQERQQRWRNAWIPYGELSEEVKEQDRVWARKILAILRERKLIP